MNEPLPDPAADRRAAPRRDAPNAADAPARPAPAAAAFDFEVNTDASLVDPDWDVFADEHERRFDLPIRYLKGRVRGRKLDNAVMKLRVGARGFYVESRRFPAAFFGDTARAAVRSVDLDEAQALVWEAVALYRSGEAQSLTCVYGDGDPPEVFFGYRSGDERFELGAIRATLPLHLRVMIDAATPSDLVGARAGVFIYQRGEPDLHQVVSARGRRLPLAGFGDLAG